MHWRPGWISENCNRFKLKPVVRCAAISWTLTVLFLVPAVQNYVGPFAFWILIAPYLSPPSGPFLIVLEQQILLIAFLTFSFAWASLGVYISSLTRVSLAAEASRDDIIAGQHIETVPTVIVAIFICVGTASILYIKARKGFRVFAYTFSACLCLDLTLLPAVLFPYPNYQSGRSVILSFGINAVVCIMGSLIVFPSSISSQFTNDLLDVISPLVDIFNLHEKLLDESFHSATFTSTASSIHTKVAISENGLASLSSSARLLQHDLVYCRFSPEDLRPLSNWIRSMVGRANGLATYTTLVDPSNLKTKEGTPAPSMAATAMSRPFSKTHSRTASFGNDEGFRRTPPSHSGHQSPRNPNPSRPHYGDSHQHGAHHSKLHHSLLSLARLRASKREQAVGYFVSQRYLELETARLDDPRASDYIGAAHDLLRKSCTQLLPACKGGLVEIRQWLETARRKGFTFLPNETRINLATNARIERLEAATQKLSSALETFRDHDRHFVIDPYRAAFEEPISDGESELHLPPHRYLFNCYVYQFHLIQSCQIVLQIMDHIIKKEKERSRDCIWTPLRTVFQWRLTVHLYEPRLEQDDGDTDPDVIEDIGDNNNRKIFLGEAGQRDPDALPPQNIFEWLLRGLHVLLSRVSRGNILFAIKAGLFTVVLCIPSFLKATAPFAYRNRFVWAIFMGQMTLSRFRGDTAFELVARLTSTLVGGITGLFIWYTSSGAGTGNPFGLAAISALCIPAFFFARLYCPIQPITTIIYFLTIFLVIGYSFQYHKQFFDPGSPAFGWPVAWKRFVLVAVGVISAFLISFLPPSMTIRRYQRNLLSTTTTEIGAAYCSILSYAHTKHETDVPQITAHLLALQSRLKRSLALYKNVPYEYSLRGRWPATRYQHIVGLQLSITQALSNLVSVVQVLEPAWSKAFLRMTPLTDVDFQGDIMAVISMISLALRAGSPLPQITPCPLLDRFMLKYHALDVGSEQFRQTHNLPGNLSIETLKDEQYLAFCVGISTSFGIVSRLDRLMVASKEVVGELFHVRGVGFAPLAGDGPNLSRATSAQYDPPRDV